MNIVDVFGHISFVIIALSFVMRDIVWLRIVSIVGSIFSIIFNYFIPGGPIWIVIGWSAVFILIHAYNLWVSVQERQAVSFSPEEKEIFETVFQGFSGVEFMKLLRTGEWREVSKNELIVQEGKHVNEITFIYNGEASIESKGKRINTIRDGAFIGEMEFFSEKEATATVQSTSPLRCIVWTKDELKQLLVRNPNMYSAMHTIFSVDLVQKLQTTR